MLTAFPPLDRHHRFPAVPERRAPYGDLPDEPHSNNNRVISRLRSPLSRRWAASRFKQLSVFQAPSGTRWPRAPRTALQAAHRRLLRNLAPPSFRLRGRALKNAAQMETGQHEPHLGVDIASEKASLMTSACRHDNSGRRRRATPKSDMKTFGELIAEGRKRAKLTQREFAARIKMEDGLPISAPYSTTSNTTCVIRRAVISSSSLPMNSVWRPTCSTSPLARCRLTSSRRRLAKSRSWPPERESSTPTLIDLIALFSKSTRSPSQQEEA